MADTNQPIVRQTQEVRGTPILFDGQEITPIAQQRTISLFGRRIQRLAPYEVEVHDQQGIRHIEIPDVTRRVNMLIVLASMVLGVISLTIALLVAHKKRYQS